MGLRRIIKKDDAVPVIVMTREGSVMRQYPPLTTISDIRSSFLDQKISILGIEMDGNFTLSDVGQLIHPDGFLYLTITE